MFSYFVEKLCIFLFVIFSRLILQCQWAKSVFAATCKKLEIKSAENYLNYLTDLFFYVSRSGHVSKILFTRVRHRMADDPIQTFAQNLFFYWH